MFDVFFLFNFTDCKSDCSKDGKSGNFLSKRVLPALEKGINGMPHFCDVIFYAIVWYLKCLFVMQLHDLFCECFNEIL